MDYVINQRPCLLLETAELVYALVNKIPAEKLTCSYPYAIPTSEVIRIQEQVCRDLDPEDEELKFYFKGIPVGDRYGRLSCLGSCLLYAGLPIASDDIDETLSALKQSEITRVRPFHVIGLGAFSIGYSGVDHYTNMTQEFSKLPVPPVYQMQLVEIFSAFEWHVDRLGMLLRPLAERLAPLLEPWIQQAEPQRLAWAEFLNTGEAMPYMLRRVNISNQALTSVELTMRYFFPLEAPGKFHAEPGVLRLHMGIALPPGKTISRSDKPLEDWEYSALKLLSSPDRLAIIGALTKKPKSIQDLSLELGLNPGSVFRDLNNLFNVGLLSQQIIGGRNYYTANLKQIEKITDHLVSYLNQMVGTE